LALLDRIVMVDKDDILYCQSEGNYTHVILKEGKQYLVSKNIKTIERLMPKQQFLRVHKSFVVNTKYILEYVRGDGGAIVMINKKNIPVSRTHKEELLHLLKIS